jgi:hypothetical protein
MIQDRGLGMKARLSACCTQIERPGRRARRHMVGWEKDEREMSKAATSLWSAESCSLDTTAALQASKRGSRLNSWWKRTPRPRHDALSFFLSVNYTSQERRRNSCALQLGTCRDQSRSSSPSNKVPSKTKPGCESISASFALSILYPWMWNPGSK